MSELSYEDYDEVLPGEPRGELVHWMEPRPLTVGSAGLALAVAGGFALGVATALIALGAARSQGWDRRIGASDPRRLRHLH